MLYLLVLPADIPARCHFYSECAISIAALIILVLGLVKIIGKML